MKKSSEIFKRKCVRRTEYGKSHQLFKEETSFFSGNHIFLNRPFSNKHCIFEAEVAILFHSLWDI